MGFRWDWYFAYLRTALGGSTARGEGVKKNFSARLRRAIFFCMYEKIFKNLKYFCFYLTFLNLNFKNFSGARLRRALKTQNSNHTRFSRGIFLNNFFSLRDWYLKNYLRTPKFAEPIPPMNTSQLRFQLLTNF